MVINNSYYYYLIVSEDLLSLSHNLYTLGVGKELVPYLTDKEKEYWELLAPAEQELEGMKV